MRISSLMAILWQTDRQKLHKLGAEVSLLPLTGAFSKAILIR
jgi:hypothetical protein